MISRKFTNDNIQTNLIRAYVRALRYKHSIGQASAEEVTAITTLETLESYEKELDSLIQVADDSECEDLYEDEYWSLHDICSEIELELSEVVADLCSE